MLRFGFVATALAICCCWNSTALAGDEPPVEKVAVFEMTGAGFEAGFLSSLADVLATYIGRLEGYQAITKNEVDAMLNLESIKDAVGCDDVSCMAEIGAALGVELLATGSLARSDQTVTCTLQLLDTRRAKVLNRVSFSWSADAGRLPKALEPYTYLLLNPVVYEEKSGSLKVVASVPGVRVLVDDREVGITPLATLSLGIGVHEVKLSHPDYQPHQESVVILPDDETVVAANLKERPQKPIYAEWWFWTAAGVAVAGASAALIITAGSEEGTRTGEIQSLGVTLP